LTGNEPGAKKRLWFVRRKRELDFVIPFDEHQTILLALAFVIT
jgi:hypothetical protein